MFFVLKFLIPHLDSFLHLLTIRWLIGVLRFPLIIFFGFMWFLFYLYGILVTKTHVYKTIMFIKDNIFLSISSVVSAIGNMYDQIKIEHVVYIVAIIGLASFYKNITSGVIKDVVVFKWGTYTLDLIKDKTNNVLDKLNTNRLTPKKWKIEIENKNENYVRWRGIGSNLWISTRLFDHGAEELSQEIDYFAHKEYSGIEYLSAVLFFIIVPCCYIFKNHEISVVIISLLIFSRAASTVAILSIVYSDLAYIKKYGIDKWSSFVTRTYERRYLYGIFGKGHVFTWFLLAFPIHFDCAKRKEIVSDLYKAKIHLKIKNFK